MKYFFIAMIALALLITIGAILIWNKSRRKVKKVSSGKETDPTDNGLTLGGESTKTENDEERTDYGVSIYAYSGAGEVKTCKFCQCENRGGRKRCVVCGSKL